MKTLNQIPDELFNLIENKTWQSLLDSEKAIVLKFITEEEYLEMHHAFAETELHFKSKQNQKAPDKIAKHLSEIYHKNYQKSTMIPLWQAAAVFIGMIFVSVYFYATQKTVEKKIVSIIHDTLYVPQMASLQTKKVDTVIVYKYINSSNKTNAGNSLNDFVVQKNIHNNNENEITVPLFRTMSPETILTNSKIIKNKSIKEDSLVQKIGFASI
ncbi:MAG TPA: hypothetical protein PK323_02710 [Bacteroidia bacterium]|nr:hypothetical protein [Bacteroidia bacterium]